MFRRCLVAGSLMTLCGGLTSSQTVSPLPSVDYILSSPEVIKQADEMYYLAARKQFVNEIGFAVNCQPQCLVGKLRVGRYSSLNFPAEAGNSALFHTHPTGHEKPSEADEQVAREGKLYVFTVSFGRLYVSTPEGKSYEISIGKLVK